MSIKEPFPWEQEFISPQGDVLTVKYLFIEPELATSMLDANTLNRHVSDWHVEEYARAIRTGRWMFEGTPFRFSPSGLLLDGQHRLMAIEKTGIGQWAFILGGLPESVQDYIDGGRVRSVADQLSIGPDRIRNAGGIAAAANLLLRWEAWRNGLGRVTIPKPEVTEWAREHQGMLATALSHAKEISVRLNGGVSRPALAAGFVRAAQVCEDPFPASFFFTQVATGDGVRMGTPAYALRQSVIGSNVAERFKDLHKVITCWNKFAHGRAYNNYATPHGGITTAKMGDMDSLDPGVTIEDDAHAMLEQVR